MKIALLGYGKMGREVEQAALERGHTIGAVVDADNHWTSRLDDLRRCDMAVEFSTPATVVDNIMQCFNLHLPVVVGTTGWHDRLDSVAHDCQQRGEALFVASNFSIGMNVMFELNRRLAQLMDSRPEYDVALSETHHIHKLDAPSGTAIGLACDILDRVGRKTSWQLAQSSLPSCDPSVLTIEAHREGEVPGIHEVVYDSPVDTLTLRHEAKSRKGLALGAVLAAEYLLGRKGYHTMQDMLGIGR